MANATAGQIGTVPRDDAPPDPVRTFLDDACETAREQLSAAWQIEIERIQEQLANGWRGHIERIFDERFAELSAQIEQSFHATIEARVSAAVDDTRAKVRRDVAAKLNQAVRRLRAFENEAVWSRSLVDSTAGFADRAALFIVNGRSLRLEASRDFQAGARIDNTPLESAPAFAGAVESRDPVVALRTRGELSDAIAEAAGEAADQRFYLFPITSRDRVAAILYADGECCTDALEMLTTCASAVLDAQTATPERSKLVTIAGDQQPVPAVAAWFSLSKEEQR